MVAEDGVNTLEWVRAALTGPIFQLSGEDQEHCLQTLLKGPSPSVLRLPLDPLTQAPNPTLSSRGIISTHALQARERMGARNSIGTIRSHLESWGKSIP